MTKIKTHTVLIALLFFTIKIHAQSDEFQTYGHASKLPAWYEKMAARQTYPMSWTHGTYPDFDAWKNITRAKVAECFMMPPPYVPFDSKVIAEEDRGTYIAKKVVLNITGDSRVLAYMTVPKSAGPHPAVLLLHDHGGKFDIGKEKVIKPFGVSSAKLKSATDWVNLYYGSRFLGDDLAKKGYICLSVDMLNWGDRSGADPDQVQQALASNFLHLGSSWPGLIAFEDMRAAEFLAHFKDVDTTRVAAMGLSVGGFRTWQVAAMSPHITAGVSVCWMSTCVGLMVPGNNQTKGSSAYSMTHPGLAQYLDYADVAAIACPKPLMFIAGNMDHLFPVEATEKAWAKMRIVWKSQNADDKLVTKIYGAPHEYNLEMQTDAFAWLDGVFKMTTTKSNVLSVNQIGDYSIAINPNPASTSATVSYLLPSNSDVTGYLVDSLGNKSIVLPLLKQDAGKHEFRVNTGNLRYQTYFIYLEINGYPVIKKFTVVK